MKVKPKLFLDISKSLFFSSIFLLISELHAEPVCPKCEAIREYNKTHHKNYEYYEDYLKEVQGECSGPGCIPKSKDEG